jgi:hypothetical protein
MNLVSGMRNFSWSDFEAVHIIDKMQSVLDMASVGLMGHSYTKVTDYVRFAAPLKEMINMSLIPKGTGLVNGKLVFDSVEGMDANEAFALRKEFLTAGTESIGVTDEHIRALMLSNNIDYIVPYHASGLPGKLIERGELKGWMDYTDSQKEEVAVEGKFNQYMKAKRKKYKMLKSQKEVRPFEYWDKTKTGDENGKLYIAFCKKNGIAPKFAQFQNDSGYWKLLVDRKMYDSKGNYIEQVPVEPNFDMSFINKMLRRVVSGESDATGSSTPDDAVLADAREQLNVGEPVELKPEDLQQAGFNSEAEFTKSYESESLKDVAETRQEYLKRIYCMGRKK